ncbi:unnamed protein product [Amoebophrya sp. A25]|nr:unnamed protein product [Amoebophrya sp. A25]|eukprot:GSA25T00008456001.1
MATGAEDPEEDARPRELEYGKPFSEAEGWDARAEQNYRYSWDFYYEESQETSALLPKHGGERAGGGNDEEVFRSVRTVKMSVRRKIWQFLETDPTVNGILLTVILISTLAFCLETVHTFEPYKHVFQVLELIVVLCFTSELLLRYIAAPMSTKKFLSNTMNWVDILSVLPYFIEQGAALYEHFFVTNVEEPKLNLTIVRCLRLARLFKFGRYSSEMSLVAGAFLRSSVSFLMLFFMLSIAVVVFSTLMYLAEQGDWDAEMGCHTRAELGVRGDFLKSECSPFESIPLTFWWAITTMTTVGYGDTFPVTPLGKVVAGFAMVVGTLSVALPTTVLGIQFGDSYAEIQEERERAKIQLLIPSAEQRNEELEKKIAEYSALRQKIVTIRAKIDKTAIELVEPEQRDNFSSMLSVFSEAVDRSTLNIENQLLRSAANTPGLALGKGGV